MTKKEKTGLFALGFVENLSTYAEELQKKIGRHNTSRDNR